MPSKRHVIKPRLPNNIRYAIEHKNGGDIVDNARSAMIILLPGESLYASLTAINVLITTLTRETLNARIKLLITRAKFFVKSPLYALSEKLP